MSKTKASTYTNIENEIIDDENVFDIYEKMILITLLRYAKKNEAFPSLKTLANKARCNKSTIARKLTRLENIKLIQRTQRHAQNGRKTSTLYTIVDIKEFLKNINSLNVIEEPTVCRTEGQGYVAQSDKGMLHSETSITLTNTNSTTTNITKKYSTSFSLQEFMKKYDISIKYEKALLGLSTRFEIDKIEEVYIHAMKNNSIYDKVAYTIATLKDFDSNEKKNNKKKTVVTPIEMTYDWINDKERF